jgi:hypothetical protein
VRAAPHEKGMMARIGSRANSGLTQVRVYATIKIVNSEAGFIHRNVDKPEN